MSGDLKAGFSIRRHGPGCWPFPTPATRITTRVGAYDRADRASAYHNEQGNDMSEGEEYAAIKRRVDEAREDTEVRATDGVEALFQAETLRTSFLADRLRRAAGASTLCDSSDGRRGIALLATADGGLCWLCGTCLGLPESDTGPIHFGGGTIRFPAPAPTEEDA